MEEDNTDQHQRQVSSQQLIKVSTVLTPGLYLAPTRCSRGKLVLADTPFVHSILR